jgi:hypothetical protein
MTMVHNDTSINRSGSRSRGALTSYFRPHRFALYLLAGVGIAAGISLSGGSLALAKLLPILVFLPSLAMMFMCMKHGTKTPAAEPIRTLPFQAGTSRNPQR